MKKISCDGIIFDMDGVLIDVTESCRLAILKTVNYFLKEKGYKIRTTKKQVNTIKTLPGFNNDWNASFALIQLLIHEVNESNFLKAVSPLSEKNKNSSQYKRIRAIWQNFYLGCKEFKNKPLRFQEKLMIQRSFLNELFKIYGKLAIATGRPRDEAIFALNQFKIQKFFDEKFLIALDDVAKEKPNPEALLKAKVKLGAKKPIYVGDTINDCLAARRAKMLFVFVGNEILGDYQIKNVNQLMEIIV